MKDRIKQLMESQHMTQQTFSDFIGISSASLSSIFNGRTKPTLNTVEAIRSKFTKISLDWLVFGTGPMFEDDKGSDADSTVPSVSPGVEGALPFGADVSVPSPRTPFSQPNNSGAHHPANDARHLNVKYSDKPQRQITEIRIFFDDQTWETFVPKR